MPWLFLRYGQTAEYANYLVQQLLLKLPGVEGQAAIGDTPRPAADAFIRWTEEAELLLRSVFEDDPSHYLFDERYWRIREITTDSVRPYPLISAAIRQHQARLEDMQKQLAIYRQLCGDSETTVAVLDTNIYDQYQMFTQIKWVDVLKAKKVRILVPLVVVDELDRQKDNHEGRLGRRAGAVIKALRNLPYVNGDTGPLQVGPNVELDYIPEPPAHVRRASNDDEIVRQAAYLRAIAPGRVKLVTGDLGMQVRAINLEVPHVLLPENLLATRELEAQA